MRPVCCQFMVMDWGQCQDAPGAKPPPHPNLPKAGNPVQAGGMDLHFQATGAGTPLVMLHGLFGASDNWRPVAARLADRFHVFAVDQRNHGQSPHAADMDYPRMADDLNEFMTARGLDRAHVLGHSMGGKTAMQFALQYPGRVERLVVADMAPRLYPREYDPIMAALLALNLGSFTNRTQMEEALAPAVPNLALRRFLLKNLGRDGLGGFYWKINLEGIADNYRHLVTPISAATPFAGPVLFLRGEQSDYVRPEDEPLIRALFPAAEIQTLAGAGHWLHADQPDEFARRVGEFLKSG